MASTPAHSTVSHASVVSLSQRGAVRTSMKYRMIMRPWMNASAMTATVIPTLGAAGAPWPCAGAKNHDTIAMADRMIHAYVVVRAAVVVTGSPHHVEQDEDDDPEKVDHVPIGGPGFDHRHSATTGVAQFPDDHAQDHQAEADVEHVHAGEHVVEHEEFVARHGVALSDFRRPLVGLDENEHHPAQPTVIRQSQRTVTLLGACALHAACDEPRTGKQDEGIDDTDSDVQMLLRRQELGGLHHAVHHEDDEVGAEDDEMADDHDPHGSVARHVNHAAIRLRRCGGRRLLGVRHGSPGSSAG